MKHSGSIVSIDRSRGTVVLAEVGPWRVEHGEMAVSLVTITVSADTELALVYRSSDAPSGFAGDFIAERLEAWNLFPGDYVTVDCVHHGAKMLARRMTVLENDAP